MLWAPQLAGVLLATNHRVSNLDKSKNTRLVTPVSPNLAFRKMKNRLPTPTGGDGKFHFSIDRGGTFTDCHARLPDGTEIVSKLLSVDPSNYEDAPTEGIRRILDAHDPNREYPRGEKVATGMIGSIRMGTTVATNALLEREGERMGLVTTKGFGDLLKIGDQTRADM